MYYTSTGFYFTMLPQDFMSTLILNKRELSDTHTATVSAHLAENGYLSLALNIKFAESLGWYQNNAI